MRKGELVGVKELHSPRLLRNTSQIILDKIKLLGKSNPLALARAQRVAQQVAQATNAAQRHILAVRSHQRADGIERIERPAEQF